MIRSGGRFIRAGLLVISCCFLGAPAHALCFVWDPSAPGGYRDGGYGYRSIPIEAEFNRAFTVVTAKVRSVQNMPDGDLVAFMKYEVVPTETFKGPALGPFTILDENDSGRFVMDRGKTYLLFVTAAGKSSEVNSCGWSDELSAAGETLQRVRALAGKK